MFDFADMMRTPRDHEFVFDVEIPKDAGLPDNADGTRPTVRIEVKAEDSDHLPMGTFWMIQEAYAPDSWTINALNAQYAAHRGITLKDLTQIAESEPEAWKEMMLCTDFGWEDYELVISLVEENGSAEDVTFRISAPSPMIAGVALRELHVEASADPLVEHLLSE